MIGDPGKISAFYFVCSFQWQILKSLFMDFQFQDTVKSFTGILSLMSLINKKDNKISNILLFYVTVYLEIQLKSNLYLQTLPIGISVKF